MKKIYITGISGTGKTTIAEELEKKGFHTIGIDETSNLCSWTNKETQEKVERGVEINREFTSKHNWICDIEYLKKLLDKDIDLVFVVGVASNQDNFLDLFDKILILQCKPETFIKRIKNRSNNVFGKDKTVREHILEWYEDFENKMLQKGAISIDVEQPIDTVIKEVLKQANS